MARTATAKRGRAQAQAAAQAAALAASDLKIATLESIIDYSFADRKIAWEALQLPGNGFSIDGNRRLAIIGDLIIDMMLAQQWYNSGAVRAKWTNIRETVSANQNLGKFGRELGLDQCIQQSLTNLQGVSIDTMADTFEAIAGAVWLDCGKNEAVIEKFLRSMGIMEREAE